MIGWRNPSELCVLTVDDVNVEDGIIMITEPKKHYSTRMLVPGYSIMNGKNRKSFKYYLDHWRPKVENQYSKNAFYLREDGRPIEIDQYRAFIQRYVKSEFPKFHLYTTRHWCAIAKLISSRLKTGTFDIYPVMNWLGHTQIQTTMTYIRDSEQYMRIANYDLFQRVLKRLKSAEVNSLKSVQRQKWGVLTKIPPRNVYGPEESQLSQLERIPAVLFGFWRVLDFKSFEISFSFFFFYLK